MDVIVQAILALLIGFSPLDKPSPYSFEVVPECGTDPEEAACPLEPQCDVPDHFVCAPPRWSDARGGWVVSETAQRKLERLAEVSATMRAAALWHTRCRAPKTGAVTEECWPTSKWPEGPSTLVMAAAASAGWESGMREDIQYGHPPMGRGPAGEACMAQIMPEQVLPNATWLSPETRQKLGAELSPSELRAWGAREVLEGDDALFKCFAAQMNVLSRSRAVCSRKGPWVSGMYSLYGTGGKCDATGIMDDFHLKRAKTYRAFKKKWDPLNKTTPMLDPALLAALGIDSSDDEQPKRSRLVDPRVCAR